jgi:hypothetical protein
MGDNNKNVKMGLVHFKIFFLKTTGPILTRLITNYIWGEGFKFLTRGPWATSLT